MTVGQQIKKRRIELGMTQEELGRKLGYKSKSTVNKIESGINDISRTRLLDFAKVLKVSPDLLLGLQKTEQNSRKLSTPGEKVLNLMAEQGLSYGTLSNLTDIPKSNLQRYVTGSIQKVPLTSITKIAQALDVSVSYLLDEKDKTPPPNRGHVKLINDFNLLSPKNQKLVKSLIKALKEKERL